MSLLKPHYRLRCRWLPFIPRFGMTVLVWRVGDYGAWFQTCSKAVAVVSREQQGGGG